MIKLEDIQIQTYHPNNKYRIFPYNKYRVANTGFPYNKYRKKKGSE